MIDRHGNVAPTGLHRDSIGATLKNAAARAGMDATNIAGHSVRAGTATQAAINGVSEGNIAKTTGHKSRRVLRRYTRKGRLFRKNAAAKVGCKTRGRAHFRERALPLGIDFCQ